MVVHDCRGGGHSRNYPPRAYFVRYESSDRYQDVRDRVNDSEAAHCKTDFINACRSTIFECEILIT